MIENKDLISRGAVVGMLEEIEIIVTSGYMGMHQELKHPSDIKNEIKIKIQTMPSAAKETENKNAWETCTRCGGIGGVPNHPHILSGICKRCNGIGKVNREGER